MAFGVACGSSPGTLTLCEHFETPLLLDGLPLMQWCSGAAHGHACCECRVGTVRNFVLKHGSFKGFLEAHKLDIMCVQVIGLHRHASAGARCRYRTAVRHLDMALQTACRSTSCQRRSSRRILPASMVSRCVCQCQARTTRLIAQAAAHQTLGFTPIVRRDCRASGRFQGKSWATAVRCVLTSHAMVCRTALAPVRRPQSKLSACALWLAGPASGSTSRPSRHAPAVGAGCATWTSLEFSARAAEVDCLGSDLDDHYGEGRCVDTLLYTNGSCRHNCRLEGFPGPSQLHTTPQPIRKDVGRSAWTQHCAQCHHRISALIGIV